MANKNKGKVSNGMGSIRKRSNGKYEVRYTEGFDPLSGKQIQRSRSFDTEREANAFRVKILNQINEGTYVAPNKMLLADWLTFYLTHHTSNLKDLTKKSYEDRIKLHVIPAIGRVKLCKLNHVMVQEFLNALGRNSANHKALSPKTIKCIHGVLHKALNKAVTLGYLSKNPADDCTLMKVVPPDITPLTDSQTVAFLKAIQGHKYEDIYLIGLFMGLRQGEILGLTWDCINWEKHTVTVKQQLLRKRKCEYDLDDDDDDEVKYKLASVKNDKVRHICVDEEILNLFRSRREEQLAQKEKAKDLWHEPFPNLIFENEFGKNFTHANVRKHFKDIVAKIGLPEERFHNMRHNYTVAALESGDDVNTVQENLGHATPNFTLKVYDHVTATRRTESARRMNERIKMLKKSIS